MCELTKRKWCGIEIKKKDYSSNRSENQIMKKVKNKQPRETR